MSTDYSSQNRRNSSALTMQNSFKASKWRRCPMIFGKISVPLRAPLMESFPRLSPVTMIVGRSYFFSGSLSQAVSLSQSDPTSATSIQQLPLVPMVHQNSNLYDSTLSRVKRALNTVQICSDPEVEGIFNKELDAFLRRIQGIVLEKFRNDTRLSG